MFVSFLLCIILYLFLLLLMRKKKSSKDFWTERGFPSIPAKISLWELITGRNVHFGADPDYYKDIKKSGEKFGGVIEFGAPVLFVNDLDLARDIFIKDFDHFTDRRDFTKADDLFSHILFFQQGQKWKSLRAALSPAFSSGRIRRMFPHMQRSAVDLRRWIEKGKRNDINAPDAMRRLTLQIIARAGFGMDFDVFKEDSEFQKMATDVSNLNFFRKIRAAMLLFFPKISRFLKIKNLETSQEMYYDELLTTTIKIREDGNSLIPPDDFLQLIVEAKKGNLKAEVEEEDNNDLSKGDKEALLDNEEKERGKFVWTDKLAKAQAFLFLAAGFDGVAVNLTNALAVLTEYSEIQERLFQEVKNKDVSYENINSLEYMDKFFNEMLRLYPPTRLERKCVKDYELPGSRLVIPKGTMVAFIPEGIQRDEDHYPDPLTFDPERFSPEEKAARHPYAYMPFGHGPRNCIGRRFASVETKTALAYILKDFEVEASKRNEEGPAIRRYAFGFRTSEDFRVNFVPRKEGFTNRQETNETKNVTKICSNG